MRLSTKNVFSILKYKVLRTNACQIIIMKRVLPCQVDQVFYVPGINLPLFEISMKSKLICIGWQIRQRANMTEVDTFKCLSTKSKGLFRSQWWDGSVFMVGFLMYENCKILQAICCQSLRRRKKHESYFSIWVGYRGHNTN